VEIDLVEEPELLKDGELLDLLEGGQKAWKRGLIDVLKKSPSKERKFLRWRFIATRSYSDYPRSRVLEKGELEVFPETYL